MTVLRSSQRVLPTLNNDGTRRWIRPRRFAGRFERARFGVAWGLIVLFAALPFVKIGARRLIMRADLEAFLQAHRVAEAA